MKAPSAALNSKKIKKYFKYRKDNWRASCQLRTWHCWESVINVRWIWSLSFSLPMMYPPRTATTKHASTYPSAILNPKSATRKIIAAMLMDGEAMRKEMAVPKLTLVSTSPAKIGTVVQEQNGVTMPMRAAMTLPRQPSYFSSQRLMVCVDNFVRIHAPMNV